jgi:hypothetical protein
MSVPYAQQLKALHSAVLGDATAMLPLVHAARHNAITPQMRIAIYAEGYIARLVEATKSDYPALLHYMGAEQGDGLLQGYVRSTPSIHWDLNMYPVGFAAYVVQQVSDPTAQALAMLEGAVAEVFWLPESAPLNPAAFASMSEEEFGEQRFQLRAAARLLALPASVNAALSAYRAGEDSCFASISAAPEYVLVVRSGYEVQRLSLDFHEYTVLHALQAGATFNDALAAVPDVEMLAAALPSYLARWFANGVFANTVNS